MGLSEPAGPGGVYVQIPLRHGGHDLHRRASQRWGYDSGNPHTEANIDTQYTEAMAYPAPHIFYSTGRGPLGTKDWYFSWLDFILDKPRIPQTISTSYGINENRCSRGYVVQVCNLFAQLGVRSVSVLFSSGDNGVGEGNCVTDSMVLFVPLFPATCTCGVFLRLGVVHKCGSRTLTTSPRFGRSLGHRRQRNDGLRAGDCSGFLRRRLLGLLSAHPSYQEQAVSPGGPPSSATGIRAFTSAFASVT